MGLIIRSNSFVVTWVYISVVFCFPGPARIEYGADLWPARGVGWQNFAAVCEQNIVTKSSVTIEKATSGFVTEGV